jgi:hypothetical protein
MAVHDDHLLINSVLYPLLHHCRPDACNPRSAERRNNVISYVRFMQVHRVVLM